MGHRNGRLSAVSRQLLVERVEILGKPVAMVARELGVSRATGYKWVRRYRAEGRGGLEDRSSRPHRLAYLTRYLARPSPASSGVPARAASPTPTS